MSVNQHGPYLIERDLLWKKCQLNYKSVLSDYLFYILVQTLLSWASIKPFSDRNIVCRLPADSWANSWLGNDTVRSSGLVYTGGGCFSNEICSLVHKSSHCPKGPWRINAKIKGVSFIFLFWDNLNLITPTQC